MAETNQNRWDEEQLFVRGEDYFAALEQQIDAATTSVDVEMYIFRPDDLGLRMLATLGRAVKRRVRVRLLVDGVGSFGHVRELAHRCTELGIAFAAYRALPFPWRGHAPAWSDWFSNLFYFFDRVNGRSHVKLWLIDGVEVWTGSFNVSTVHLDQEGRVAWKDIGIRVRGSGAAVLHASYENQWLTRGWFERKERSSAATDLVVISVSRKSGRALYCRLLLRLRRAKQRIWLVTAYFVPSGSLLRALKRAARRGVDVHIVVPQRSDVLFMPLVTSAYYRGLLRAGARVFEYSPTVLHAKTILVDDEMLVGSSNLNHRSLLHDRELDVALTLPETKRELESVVKALFDESVEVTSEIWEKQGFWRRFWGRVFLKARYWL